jgi:phosphonoacetate hydrolase
LLGHGLKGGVCFSAEKADLTTVAEHGVENVLAIMEEPLPSVYSADLTTFTFRAGLKLLEGKFPGVTPPRLLYLSTTDYIQHKHAPGTPEANALYSELDKALEAFDRLGASWVLTADHGMSAKSRDDGSPNVLYLQSMVDELVGRDNARVILPITDPYVVHHGALGSYASIYVSDAYHAQTITSVLKTLPGMEWVGTKEQACREFHLPADRLGEVIAISDAATALGTRREEHDLGCLTVPLRSHGGLGEREIPLYSNRAIISEIISDISDTQEFSGKISDTQEFSGKISDSQQKNPGCLKILGCLEKRPERWHNFDAFYLALNLLQ